MANIRNARDRRRPTVDERRTRLLRLLRCKIWPSIPKKALGRRLSRREEDAILGYGPEGV